MLKENFTRAPLITDIHVTDPFWRGMMEKIRTHVIPYQWEALNDRVEGAEPSHCIRNFEIAAGRAQGEFKGFVFQDSDLYKWLEAVAYSLAWHPDPALEQLADEAVALICAAQQEDGYLDTYYIINGLEKRFTNLKDNHELYCLGHMTEAAIAYYSATGKDAFLKAVLRNVDCVDGIFGPAEEGKLPGYPGHEILEMALMRLYEVTGDEKHKRLAKFFIDERGKQPLFFEEEWIRAGRPVQWDRRPINFDYHQAARPVREQAEAIGHAVRAVYLYSGMASVAKETRDNSLYRACDAIWENIRTKQSYITGAIGQSNHGEAFTYDYDLPNGTAYAETCAQIGLVFFARRMLEICPDSRYSDLMERALFNGVISGMSLDGKSFFYVNPLEAIPEASKKDPLRKEHVKVQRQKWFGCACCPPNVARLLASVGTYAYTLREDALFTHLYLGGELDATLSGNPVKIKLEGNYPWEGDIRVSFAMKKETRFTYALRIPGWCRAWKLSLNGQEAAYTMENGYALMDRIWRDGETLTLTLDMPGTLVESDPRVRENIGQVAVQRGPVVYCLEEEDNGPDLHAVFIKGDTELSGQFEPALLGGVYTLTAGGLRLDIPGHKGLYAPARPPEYRPVRLKWIPYFVWANRSEGEMRIWIHRVY